MKTKVCTQCGNPKTLLKFDKSKTGKFGVRGNCKDCKKRYQCLDCENLIDYTTFHYGHKRCKSCANKGVLNPNFKHGLSQIKPFCVDCGNEISCYKSLRCQKCNRIHNSNKNPNFKSVQITINCDICHNYFKKYIYEIKQNNFCSNECRGIWVGKTRCGSNHHYFGINSVDHPSYIHGNGYMPYPIIFNNKLKQEIRERDNFTCQCCNLKEKDHYRNNKQINLTVHHIDYNKMNCDESNLITVCHKCNIKANYDRDYWFVYYTYIINVFIRG